MTQRKPRWVPVESWIDQQIRAAEGRGDFDNLPGKGKPLPEVDTRAPAWWVKRKLRDEKLSLSLPLALQLKKDVQEGLARLHLLKAEALVRERLNHLNTRIREVNRTAIDGPPTTLAVMDVEARVLAWKGQH